MSKPGKLGFGCIVLGALAGIGLHVRLVADETMTLWVCFIGITLLPVLTTTGLIPAERGDGTLQTLLSLPVRPWKILTAKTLMGAVLCVVPLAVAAMASLLVAGEREMPTGAMLGLYLRSALASTSLMLWMLAATSRLASEARAGLVALGVLIFWSLANAGLTRESVPAEMASISPFVFVYDASENFELTPSPWLVLTVQLIILAALWGFALRYLAVELEGES